jgi:hypothetical protein
MTPCGCRALRSVGGAGARIAPRSDAIKRRSNVRRVSRRAYHLVGQQEQVIWNGEAKVDDGANLVGCSTEMSRGPTKLETKARTRSIRWPRSFT